MALALSVHILLDKQINMSAAGKPWGWRKISSNLAELKREALTVNSPVSQRCSSATDQRLPHIWNALSKIIGEGGPRIPNVSLGELLFEIRCKATLAYL